MAEVAGGSVQSAGSVRRTASIQFPRISEARTDRSRIEFAAKKGKLGLPLHGELLLGQAGTLGLRLNAAQVHVGRHVEHRTVTTKRAVCCRLFGVDAANQFAFR